ncbi:mycofactocin-coupled SDR family oxidoreductase [Kitasatospora phosalacinea]|uniref:3-ketoacyl-ACP reductase n=1 Tax=Kitasatospora phosalacinea TaxID=2065 RepID=A0A9W6PJP7_9ACTN|nr:mycofactocin-coupled SDR family oxidoreductase [Kitasatospora phosalacinea]GLW56062.1 3-ketoacyl-ACP reductase [Kitasatospora phosalacinea]
MRLSQKTALVTGAARGLGRACALRFAEEGADLVLLDVAADIADVPYPLGTPDQLEATARLCRERGASVLTARADVRQQKEVDDVVADALDRFGRIDVLVNNAGIAAPSGKAVHEITEDEWGVMLDVDLSGAWRTIKAVVPSMAKQRSGSIVNISSTAGLVGYRYFAGYVAAKHGLIGLTRAAALDYAALQIRVNALCPGQVREEPTLEGRMLSEVARSLGVAPEDQETAFLESQPMNALVNPEDVSSAALWLASDDARQVTGSVVTVDGGFSTR